MASRRTNSTQVAIAPAAQAIDTPRHTNVEMNALTASVTTNPYQAVAMMLPISSNSPGIAIVKTTPASALRHSIESAGARQMAQSGAMISIPRTSPRAPLNIWRGRPGADSTAASHTSATIDSSAASLAAHVRRRSIGCASSSVRVR